MAFKPTRTFTDEKGNWFIEFNSDEFKNALEKFKPETKTNMEDLALQIADFVKGIGDFTIEQTRTGAILITPSEKDNGKQGAD